MIRNRINLLLCFALGVAWQGCATGESETPTGTARVAALSSADVDRVDIYADDGDGAGPSEDQGKIGEIVGGALSVTITDIPVGTYNFRAEAFDVDVDPVNPVYEGVAPGVTITEGGDISINIVLQQVADLPDPFNNDVPIFQSFVFSPASPVVDEAVTLTVTASDADGDPLVFDWTAPGGVTLVTPQPPDPGPNTDVESVSWTAPSAQGSYLISVTATDGSATAELDVSITVDLQRGGETEVTIEYNNFPVVNSLVPNPTRIDDAAAPDTTVLTLDVTDDDTMTFQWTATGCAGSFLPDAQTQSPSFQITDRLGNDTCTLSVVIDDSRDGSNTAEVTIETGPAIIANVRTCSFTTTNSKITNYYATPPPGLPVVEDIPFDGELQLDCTPSNGEWSCLAGFVGVSGPFTVPGLGELCIYPAPMDYCQAGTISCEPGTDKNVTRLQRHDISNETIPGRPPAPRTCTVNADCKADCDAYCADIGSTRDPDSPACEGFCRNATAPEISACLPDDWDPALNPGFNQCPEGDTCDEYLTFYGPGDYCGCQCENVGDNTPAGAGEAVLYAAFSYQILTSAAERGPNGIPCDFDDTPGITFDPNCITYTTSTSTVSLPDAGYELVPPANPPFIPLDGVINPPPVVGAPFTCVDGAPPSSAAGVTLQGVTSSKDTLRYDLASVITITCE